MCTRSFWLVDTPTPGEALEVAKRLYSEQCQVPYMARFLVYAKRTDPNEARLRCFCVTDDRLEKTLELQEKYIEVARSNPVEVCALRDSHLLGGSSLLYSHELQLQHQPPLHLRAGVRLARALAAALGQPGGAHEAGRGAAAPDVPGVPREPPAAGGASARPDAGAHRPPRVRARAARHPAAVASAAALAAGRRAQPAAARHWRRPVEPDAALSRCAHWSFSSQTCSLSPFILVSTLDVHLNWQSKWRRCTRSCTSCA